MIFYSALAMGKARLKSEDEKTVPQFDDRR